MIIVFLKLRKIIVGYIKTKIFVTFDTNVEIPYLYLREQPKYKKPMVESLKLCEI